MNMSGIRPADRAKAVGLGVAIVVVAVFVTHTIMGAVSPRQSAPPRTTAAPPVAPPAGTPPAADTVPPGTTPALEPTVDAGDPAFPTDKARAATATADAKTGAARLRDPFVPIPGMADETAMPSRPSVSLAPAPQMRAGMPRAFGGVTPQFGPGGLPAIGAAGAPMAIPPPPEPQIQVLGLVAGPPSVATVRVEERTVIAHPGDLLAKGYRVTDVDPEGVRVTAHRRTLWMRVGAVLNETTKVKTAGQ